MFKRDRNLFIIIVLLLVRIPLSRIIGDNGMGFLSGPMEMFMLFSLLFGSGLTGSMKAMMYERVNRSHYRNAGLVFALAKRYAFVVSIAMLILNVVFYDIFCKKILLDNGQRLAYLFVGPAVFLSIFIYLNRGYLAGTDNVFVMVIGEIIESIAIGVFMILGAIIGVKKGQSIAALLRFDDVTAMYGALGAMIGLCIGLLIGLLSYIIVVLIYQKTFRHLMKSDTVRRTEYSSDIFRKLFSGIFLDGALSFIIQLPIILLIIFYRKNGIVNAAENVNSMVGVFYSKYLSIVGLISAFAVFHIDGGMKGIVMAYNDDENHNATERMLRLSGRVLYFVIPASIFVIMLSGIIIPTLFTGMVTTVTSVLSVGGLVIIFYPLMYLFMKVLVKLNYHTEVIILSLISFVIAGLFGFIFVCKKGNGLSYMAVSLIIFYALNSIMGLVVLIKNLGLKIQLLKHIVFPIIISGTIGILVKLISSALFSVIGGIVTISISIVLMWFIYNFACIFLRVVSAGAMNKKLLGIIFVRIGQNLGIY